MTGVPEPYFPLGGGHQHISVRPGTAFGSFLKGLPSADAMALYDRASDERNPDRFHNSATRKAVTARPPNAVRTA